MGLRAGASLTGLEFTGRRAGPKYFSRSGKATWIGVFRNPAGQPVGPFITEPNKETGDTTSDVYPGLFHDYKTSARGPVYMDCRGASDEDMEDMYHWLRNEGNTGLLGHLKEEGIDPTQHSIEFGTYEFGTRGGVWHTTGSETCLQGLYAAGDEYAILGGMAGSSIWGWIAGENMTRYSKEIDFIGLKSEREKIEEASRQLTAIRDRKNGATWQEANMALQSVMSDYAGELRSHPMLEQGLLHLKRLERKTRDTLTARNGHELGRCIEVLNLMELGQALMAAAMERKETRGPHRRADYPFTNPMLDQKILVKKSGDAYSFEWREKLF
jgi:succinate dehydrogenase/fumarate reductase flavoprotein subunit